MLTALDATRRTSLTDSLTHAFVEAEFDSPACVSYSMIVCHDNARALLPQLTRDRIHAIQNLFFRHTTTTTIEINEQQQNHFFFATTDGATFKPLDCFFFFKLHAYCGWSPRAGDATNSMTSTEPTGQHVKD
jgi:hypothetical protein